MFRKGDASLRLGMRAHLYWSSLERQVGEWQNNLVARFKENAACNPPAIRSEQSLNCQVLPFISLRVPRPFRFMQVLYPTKYLKIERGIDAVKPATTADAKPFRKVFVSQNFWPTTPRLCASEDLWQTQRLKCLRKARKCAYS